MWICVGPRDPSTKPSRDWLRVVVRKPRLDCCSLGQRKIKLRRHQGPTGGGVFGGGEENFEKQIETYKKAGKVSARAPPRPYAHRPGFAI